MPAVVNIKRLWCASIKKLEPEAAHQFQTSDSPLARRVLKIDQTTRERLCKKFDVCYVLAKEGLSFKKYSKNLELESRHEVDIGVAYRSDVSARTFCLLHSLKSKAKFLTKFFRKTLL